MDNHQQSPVALVTGAGSGIGQALAHQLSEQGYLVLVSDVNASAAGAVSKAIVDQGRRAEPLVLDVSSQDSIDAASATVKQRFNRLDVLINNAGIQYVSRLEDFPADRWRLINDILLVGPAMLTRGVLPLMKANNYGRIINIGSIHALVASPYKSAYVAAKHGLLGFAKTVALELETQDITINTICPAYVKTALVEKQIADQAKENGISEEQVINTIMLAPMPKKSFIDLEEISGSVQFLLSPAAKNMTAQTLTLDGGWTAR